MTATLRDAAGARRFYCLAVLTGMSALNQLDRQLMSIVLDAVRREFGLSDVQLGLISGLAFAALYTTLSVPAALWAVKHNRRNLVAMAAAVWGGMTMLCGAAQSFAQLFAGRLGVGIGEAGASPPAHAMISDLYPPGERATAMAIWAAGINMGVFLAFMLGGLIAQRWGWRMAFIAAGGMTVLFAVLMRMTVREPPRAAEGPSVAAMRSMAQVRESCHLMWQDPVLRHVCCGAIITATVGYGALAWVPSYLVRSHHMDIGSIGVYLAIAIGVGGALGNWLGGRYSDALRRRDIRWSLWLVAALFIGSKPFSIAFYLLHDTSAALVVFIVPATIGAIFMGPSIATLHDRMPATLRPIASAIYLVLVNFIGLGLGPLVTGALSQVAFGGYGEDSLRYALVVVQVFGVWGGLHFYLAGRDLARAPRT